MPRTALIIGASSMLGRRLASYLGDLGFRVFSCGRSDDCDIHFDLADTRFPDIPEGLKAAVVFHCASSFADDSIQGCIENEKVNALGAYPVAEITAAVGCKHLVFAGSISSSSESGVTPETSYGASKLRGEDILEWSLNRHGIAFTSLRFPQLYDEHGECCRHQLWFGRIVAYAYAGKQLRMPGGSAMRNFIHASDAVRLMHAALETGTAGRLDITHPISMTSEEIAQLAYDTFDNGGCYEVAPEKQPFRAIYIPCSKGSFVQLQCWPQISMFEGLEMIKTEGSPENFGPMDVM